MMTVDYTSASTIPDDDGRLYICTMTVDYTSDSRLYICTASRLYICAMTVDYTYAQ